jgi:mannosyltransferase OCH1-like enzyme
MNEFVYLLAGQWSKNINNLKKASIKNGGIPKKIHWIWLSKDPRGPKKSYDISSFIPFFESFIVRNPNYEFYLWTNFENIINKSKYSDKITIVNDFSKLYKKSKISSEITDFIDNGPNVGLRSDILRMLILKEIGGLYADVNDMLCLMPLDSILTKFDFICGTEPMMYVNNAFVGARKGHELIKRFFDFLDIKNIYDSYDKNFRKEDLDDWVISHTGPKYISEIIFGYLYDKKSKNDKGNSSRVLVGPSKMFYANYNIKKDSKFWITPYSFTGHFDQRTFI